MSATGASLLAFGLNPVILGILISAQKSATDRMASTGEAQPEYTSDETFNDPSAEIVLVSKDKVRFRVHTWHLSKHSAFIADMISVVDSAGRSDEEPPKKKARGRAAVAQPSESPCPPIELDHASLIVRTYIALVYSFQKSNFPLNLKVQEMLDLLVLCDRMQSTTWNDWTHKLIRGCYGSEAWEVFKYAAEHGDIVLARKAIKYQYDETNSPIYRYPDVQLDDFSALSPDWTFEILRVMFKHKDKDGSKYKMYEEAAKDFFKDKPSTKTS